MKSVKTASWIGCLLTSVCTADAASVEPEPLSLQPAYSYCIVGAGPGGIQLGHYMHQQSRDFIIFERQQIPSSFFARFPVHRQLISLNKRFTGRDNPEFNMRHDWNSLLDSDATPVTKRATERFPSADVLVEYMADFVKPQEAAGRISYSTDVKSISRNADGEPFTLVVQRTAFVANETWYLAEKKFPGSPGPQSNVQCKVVIMANGLWVPNKTPMEGIELATGYEELPATGESFTDKAVTVLGMGNAALETANAVADYAQYVHIWPTRDGGPKWPHTSWESRYVGSARAIRMGPVDGYLLKSLDALPLGDLVVASPDRMVIKSCMGGKKCLMHKSAGRTGPDGESLIDLCGGPCPADTVAEFEKDPVSKGMYVEKSKVSANGMTSLATMDGQKLRDYKLTNFGESVYIALSNISDANIDRLVDLKRLHAGTLSKPYDTVVRAMGWKHNASIYGPGAVPLLQSQKKYARMTHEYESVNVPGMYFCGTLGHGKDFKRAAGGFIHGFRYTARALHRILEEKHESGSAWPRTTFRLPDQITEFAQHIMDRQNSASGPYQMFYTLGDAMVFAKGRSDQWEVTYMEDMPVDYLNTKYKASHRMWWTFGFDGQRRTLADSIEKGTGFEPWIWYWAPNVKEERYREVFRSVENLHTDWSHKFILHSMVRWIRARVEHLQSGKDLPDAAAWSEDKEVTNGMSLADLKVVELDVVFVNHLAVPVTLLRGDEIFRTLEPGEVLSRFQTFDGEEWIVQYKNSVAAGGKNVVRSLEMRFENGVYQEIHIDVPQPWDSGIFDDAPPQAASGTKTYVKASPRPLKYTHANFLATHTDSFCDLMGPQIMNLLAGRGYQFDSFADVKAQLPNSAAWVHLFEQVTGSIAAMRGDDIKDWERTHMTDAVEVLQAHHMDAVAAAADAAMEALLPTLGQMPKKKRGGKSSKKRRGKKSKQT